MLESDVQDGHLHLTSRIAARRSSTRSGLSSAFVEDLLHPGTATTIEGVGFTEIAEEAVAHHRNAYGSNPI